MLWNLLDLLYDIAYFIYKSADSLKWDALLIYIVYVVGKRSGMKMFRKFLTAHFPYLADENEDWRKWATNQIELLGGRKWQPTKQYLHMKRSARVDQTNLITSSTLSQEGTGPEGVLTMAKKLIAVDDGHGMETAGKRTPNNPDGSFMRENEFNRAVVDKLISHLKRNGFDVLHVSPGDTDIPLKTRTDLANNTIDNGFGRRADIYVSVHANAMGSAWNAKAKGIETFYHEGSKEGKKFAKVIQDNLMKGTLMVNRGLKTANLHVTRESKMPAVLVECGFMDNPVEAVLLKSEEYRAECAEELAKGICEYFSRKYIPEGSAISNNGLTPVEVVAVDQNFIGFLMNGSSWVPARALLNHLNASWGYNDKTRRIRVNSTEIETQIIDGVSYVKSTDLKAQGVIMNVMMDPDALNPKKILIYPIINPILGGN